MARIALLSNVNTDPIVRLLQKDASHAVFSPQGYGGELGLLLNTASALHAFRPDIVFLVEDLEELLHSAGPMADPAVIKGASAPSAEHARLMKLKAAVNDWFTRFESSLKQETVYYLSDGFMHTPLDAVSADPFIVSRTETVWNKRLVQCIATHKNVRVFPYRRLIVRIGAENAFSRSMWYLGKIPHSIKAQMSIADEVLHAADVETRTAKKVLALDLDNTLWGGLAGERDHTEIALSDEHTGLAYKNCQRILRQMKEQGVLLVIVSKNNEADALDVIRNHPHMILRENDFAAMRINWQPKHENLISLAEELNLGLDSFVFFDDSAQERALVSDTLPEVTVPEFPEKISDLPDAMKRIYRACFEKSVLTEEDRDKTAQYAQEHARKDLQSRSTDFDSYLRNLKIRMTRLHPANHVDRITQLFGKTNQFNLTTRRLNRQQIELLLTDEWTRIFCYNITDCFGDLGLVAIAVLKMPGGVHFPDSWKSAAVDRMATDVAVKDSDLPVITDLIMSCRVMGRLVERAVIEDVEYFAYRAGYDALRAVYLPTAKNAPVKTLYPDLGYTLETRFSGASAAPVANRPGAVPESAAGIYRIDLKDKPKREYVLTFDRPRGGE